MVLDGAGDEVAARGEYSGERQVVALCAAAGEDNLCGAAAQQAGDLVPGALDGGAGPLAMEVYGRCIAELLGEPGTHGREDLWRERGRGIGVHVDTMHGYLQFTLHCRKRRGWRSSHGAVERGGPGVAPTHSSRGSWCCSARLLPVPRAREALKMNCRRENGKKTRAFVMAAAMLAGGLMVHAMAHAQGATAKADAKTADSTSAQPPSEVYGQL